MRELHKKERVTVMRKTKQYIEWRNEIRKEKMKVVKGILKVFLVTFDLFI